jgi:hypothetical protein
MNLEQIFEHLSISLADHSEQLRKLIDLQNTAIRADVRGGFDSICIPSLVNTPVCVKPADGQIFGYWIFNSGSAVRYLKFYQGQNSPVVGTSQLKWTMGIPVGSGAIYLGTIGIPFKTGLWIAATTGYAESDTGAPSAGEILVNIFYK